jgi:hypothetical protein
VICKTEGCKILQSLNMYRFFLFLDVGFRIDILFPSGVLSNKLSICSVVDKAIPTYIYLSGGYRQFNTVLIPLIGLIRYMFPDYFYTVT